MVVLGELKGEFRQQDLLALQNLLLIWRGSLIGDHLLPLQVVNVRGSRGEPRCVPCISSFVWTGAVCCTAEVKAGWRSVST